MKMESLLFLFFLLPLVFFLSILLNHINNGNRLPPGPPGLPLIGHLHMLMFDKSIPHVFFWKLSQKYGSLMSLRIGSKQTLVVSSAKMAEEVLKTHDIDFCGRPSLRCPRKLSYNSLDLAFSPYNDYYREMKKLCAVHLFNRAQQYRPVREAEVARLIEKISRLSVESKLVNLSEAIMCLSSAILCRVCFGKEEGSESETSRLHELLNESQAMLSSFSFSDYFPFMGWVDRFTRLLDRLERTYEKLDGFYQELIDEHLDPYRLKPEQDDIIDVLLRIWKDGDFPGELTIDHIKAIIMNMFVAGTDTTAATVIWVMSFLMKNPNCLKKTQTEVRNLIGKKDFINDVQGLTYLQAVIKETYRLQPIAPLLVPRETLRNCNVGGFDVPAKTLVYVNTWAIGRDPEAWENPEEFRPERFIDSPIDYKGQHFELLPFGAGRRACPGMSMGIAAVELALANLLYKFDWEMPAGMNVEDLDFDALPGLTIHKKNALVLKARMIND